MMISSDDDTKADFDDEVSMIEKQQLLNGKVKVIFTLPASVWAETISLVGDFNNWSAQAHPFQRIRNDFAWNVSLELSPGSSYQFCYLVNGSQWQNEPQADGSAPNPFGGINSVITL